MAETPTHTQFFRSKKLQVGFSRRRGNTKLLLDELELSLSPGEFVCLIGVNGSGKTTLLKTLGGLHPKLSGEVFWDDTEIDSLSLKALSALRSISLTDSYQSANLNVLEFISQAKWQSFNWKGKLPAEEEARILQIADQLQLTNFLSTPVFQLSDGERQRATLARALGQDCEVILMDEPLSHLDVIHKHQLMTELRKICHEEDKGIVISTHDWELALKYADTLWWITHEQGLFSGGPEDIMLSGFPESYLENSPIKLDLAQGKIITNTQAIHSIYLSGDPIPYFWTQHALLKIKVQPTDNANAPISIHIHSQKDGYQWEFHSPAGKKTYDKLSLLIRELEKLLATS
ncbi:MAG: ABC transporter ATP-binding protein [Bacteroidota bacterium]